MLGELSTSEIESVLANNVVGRLGVQADGKVYIVPVTYVYAGGAIYGHTTEGLKIDLLRKNPQCCFEVDEIQTIADWQSIMAWGRFEELQGVEAADALEKISAKLLPMFPGETSHPSRMGPTSSGRTSTQSGNSIVYRIVLTEKTGRYER
ncbi:MAG: pyridoxamine 5'-phosphate oxidase family protein [Cyclobacteriaceae bacterium]|nr:pyridoxamine 5'-phosphate oxidase family protein [Cyclobacteriaceae bacterium]